MRAWLHVALLLSWAGCGRPLGAVFDYAPSAGLPEVIRDEPWPMEGRCPGRTHFTPVVGPRQGVVEWMYRCGDVHPFHSGVSGIVDRFENVYVLTGDANPSTAGVLLAIDASGNLLWTSALNAPVYGAPALGGEGRIFASLPYSIAAIGSDGGSLGEVTYGAWPPAPADFLSSGSPVIRWDGGVLASTFRYLVSVGPLLSLDWETEWDDRVRTGATMDVEGRSLVLTDYGWDLGYPALGLVRYDGEGVPEELAILEGNRIGSVAVDVDSTIYVVTEQPHREPEQMLLAYSLSAQGEPLWSFEDEKADDFYPAMALSLGPVVRLAWNAPQHYGRVVEVSGSGARRFDTSLDGRVFGQMIVDGEGWTYVGGSDSEQRPTVYALDDSGELRWRLTLPGDGYRASLLAMGGRGRLYAVTDRTIYAIGSAR